MTLQRIPQSVRSLMLEDFIRDRASASPYLRDVAREFAEWAAPRWLAQGELPSYLGDLARFELMSFEVGAAIDDEPAGPSQLSADAPVRFQKAVRLEGFEYAVHRLSQDEDGDESAEERPCWLMAYRDAAQGARSLELSRFGAALIARLLQEESLGAAAIAACEEVEREVNDDALSDVALLLEELEARGAILADEDERMIL